MTALGNLDGQKSRYWILLRQISPPRPENAPCHSFQAAAPQNYSISIDGDVRAREGAAQLSRLRTTKGEGRGLPNPPAGEPNLTCKRPMEIGKDGI